MPIYLYWGEDDFAIAKAVDALRDRVLDSNWVSFNYDKIPPDQSDAVIVALNQAMTPAFGAGDRLVWLVDTTLCQQCPPELLAQLERTLPVIPESCVLLLTTRNKPDGRLKSTKLLQKCAGKNVREFATIPPWKTDELVRHVREAADDVGVKLTGDGAEMLAQAVGNDTRQLYAELGKLRLYAAGRSNQAIGAEDVASLTISSTQNSLQLAAAIRTGDAATALAIVSDLIHRNEPGLRIVATLIGQFRTWLWVRLMMDAGEADERIAQAAEVGNPKRIYFLRQEVKNLRFEQLQKALPVLLELEISLKRGAQEMPALQTKVIELCQVLS
ncbi:DNA polymerase III subunit delta [Microcoleus sp. FACHB-68]|uniref:DNA polymerase III subunit delta n=1 Tax=Microcoleus sp. FACHB-68 TaxID=2692826 RepID=UPI001689B19C|nr:DNA polymerase III subunit delta [Microcoleus sp. FACHB-68]MBD1938175.1 DNA polymerase III subunit delta [Microcoleus sp. FACHB-68]